MSSGRPSTTSTASAGSTGSASSTGSAGSARQLVGTWWRVWRWVLLIAVVIVLAALITALMTPRGSSDRLGPTNPAPDGSRALVQILRRQGVEVQGDRDSRAVVASTDRQSSLLITNTETLGSEQLDRLARDDVADLVLVEPDEATLRRLAPHLHLTNLVESKLAAPDCAVPAAQSAGTARAGGFAYSLTGGPSDGLIGGTVCYPVPGHPAQGSYAIEQDIDRKITVIGQSDLLTNEFLGRDGNAALALGSLGEQPKLIWYTPNPLEPNSGQHTTLRDLLPDWVLWVIIQLALVAVVAMLWRARRMGRLVSEPLPIVVRAAETQEGRARLYRQASARGRAAATLRTSALRRLAVALAAPPGTTPEQLIALVSTATGWPAPALGALLLGAAPNSDDELIALADGLDAIQQGLSHRGSANRRTPINLKGSSL